MSFKSTREKYYHVSEFKTLDESHNEVVLKFKNKKRTLPRKKEKLGYIKDKYAYLEAKKGSDYTKDDIKLRSKLKSNIKSLENEIYDIENNISELDYYSQIGDLLMEYYDSFDKEDEYFYKIDPSLSEQKTEDQTTKKLSKLDRVYLQRKKSIKPKKVTRRRGKRVVNKKRKGVTSYFKCEKIEDNTNKISRAALSDSYRKIIDKEYVSRKNNSSPIKYCDECNIEKMLIKSEGLLVCRQCGEAEMVIIESERPNYKESIPEKPGYPYKRLNHFNE